MNGINLTINRCLELKNQDLLELRSLSSDTPVRRQREFIALNVLVAIRALARARPHRGRLIVFTEGKEVLHHAA